MKREIAMEMTEEESSRKLLSSSALFSAVEEIDEKNSPEIIFIDNSGCSTQSQSEYMTCESEFQSLGSYKSPIELNSSEEETQGQLPETDALSRPFSTTNKNSSTGTEFHSSPLSSECGEQTRSNVQSEGGCYSMEVSESSADDSNNCNTQGKDGTKVSGPNLESGANSNNEVIGNNQFRTADLSQQPKQIAACYITSKSKETFYRGLEWAPDGLCIATNADDNILRIYNLPSNASVDFSQQIQEESLVPVLNMAEGETIYDFCWYPLMSSYDAATCCLLSTSKDHPIHLWDAFTGEIRCSYRAYNHLDEISAANSVCFSLDGSKILCGFNKLIRIFDTSRPGRTFEERDISGKHTGLGQAGIVSCLTCAEDLGGIYAAGSFSKSIGIYSLVDGTPLGIIHGHSGGLTQLKFSSDGMKLYSGGRKDNRIHCWDLRNLTVAASSFEREVATNQRIQFDIDRVGHSLVTGNTNGFVSAWPCNDEAYTIVDGRSHSYAYGFYAHSDAVNGVGLHPYLPLLATSSGQRHFIPRKEKNDSDSEDEGYQDAKNLIDNSLRIWSFPKTLSYNGEHLPNSDETEIS